MEDNNIDDERLAAGGGLFDGGTYKLRRHSLTANTVHRYRPSFHSVK
jgi:hypothetical protein